jgi:hypothetical protein
MTTPIPSQRNICHLLISLHCTIHERVRVKSTTPFHSSHSMNILILWLLQPRGMCFLRIALKEEKIWLTMCLSKGMPTFHLAIFVLRHVKCRGEVITLQNPHGFPSNSVPTTTTTVVGAKVVEPSKTTSTTSKLVQSKAAVPCTRVCIFPQRHPNLLNRRECVSLLIWSSRSFVNINLCGPTHNFL